MIDSFIQASGCTSALTTVLLVFQIDHESSVIRDWVLIVLVPVHRQLSL